MGLCYSDFSVRIMETPDFLENVYLENIKLEDTKNFVPPITYGKVVKVYDGDTITIASKLPYLASPIYNFHVRLNGIDAPEIRSKNEIEKKLAIISKEELHNLIFGKVITLRNISTEKYGRILADVYLQDLFVNKWLLDNNLCVKYDGGTKIRPASWD